MTRGSTAPFQWLSSSFTATSSGPPAAARSSSPFTPNATPSARLAPLCRLKRAWRPSSPIGRTSRTRAAGTSSRGSGLPLPNGASRSSSSATGRPRLSPPTTASTGSARTRSAGVRTDPTWSAKSARKRSRLAASISRPAAARWPPKRSRCSAQASRPARRSNPGMLRPEPRPAAVGAQPDHDRRAPVELDHARGDDADDARMPPLAGDDDPGRLAELVWELGEGSLGSGERLALGEATLAVGAVELLRDALRPLRIAGQHELDPGVGAVEPARGVDPRRQAEGEVALVQALDLAPGGRDQRPQPDPPPAARLGQALSDQRPVLAAKWNEIGDGGQRDEIEVRAAVGRIHAGALAERRGELVRDRGGAQLLERVSREARVQDRAIGQPIAGLMVVRDDRLEAELASKGDLAGTADPAVGGEQHPGAPGGEAADGVGGEPVAVGDAVGQVPIAIRARVAQGGDEDRGRAHAVDVVVAVDGDLEALADGGKQARDDLLHRLELERVVGLAGGEEVTCGGRGPVAPAHQHHRHGLGDPELGGQLAHLPVGAGLDGESGARSGGRHSVRLRTGPDGTSPPAR